MTNTELTTTLNRWIENNERNNASELADIAGGYAVDIASVYNRIAQRTAKIEAWRETIRLIGPA